MADFVGGAICAGLTAAAVEVKVEVPVAGVRQSAALQPRELDPVHHLPAGIGFGIIDEVSPEILRRRVDNL